MKYICQRKILFRLMFITDNVKSYSDWCLLQTMEHTMACRRRYSPTDRLDRLKWQVPKEPQPCPHSGPGHLWCRLFLCRVFSPSLWPTPVGRCLPSFFLFFPFVRTPSTQLRASFLHESGIWNNMGEIQISEAFVFHSLLLNSTQIWSDLGLIYYRRSSQ